MTPTLSQLPTKIVEVELVVRFIFLSKVISKNTNCGITLLIYHMCCYII